MNDLELQAFKYYLIRQGMRAGTINKHVANLNRTSLNVGSLNIDAVEPYIYKLYEKGKNVGYLNTIIQALRHYGHFKNSNDYKRIRFFKLLETNKGTFSDDEINKFLQITPKEVENHLQKISSSHRRQKINRMLFLRYSIFFSILAHTGMRPGEVANLTLSAIDFGIGCILLGNDTKTATPRAVPIHPALLPVLQKYIKDFSIGANNRLFPDFQKHQWKEQFKTRINYLGIKREKLSTYSLRHSFITRMIEEDVALPKLMKIVGHKRIDTTYHYTHLTKKDIIQAIHKDRLGRDNISKQERIFLGRKALEDLGFNVIVAKEADNGNVIYETL